MCLEFESYEDYRDGNFRFVAGAIALTPHNKSVRSGPLDPLDIDCELQQTNASLTIRESNLYERFRGQIAALIMLHCCHQKTPHDNSHSTNDKTRRSPTGAWCRGAGHSAAVPIVRQHCHSKLRFQAEFCVMFQDRDWTITPRIIMFL